EGDVTFPDFLRDGRISSPATARSAIADEVDYIATLRGRFGHAFDHWLIYGTGGFAWSQARFVESPGFANDEDKALRTRFGWVFGGGVELPISPDWTAKLEYLYHRLGTVGAVFPSGTRYQSVFDIHSLRVGLNRQFRWPAASGISAKASEPWPIAPGTWNIHGQFTFIEQGYPAFRSPYEGPQSLSGAGQAKNTASATAFIGFRPLDGTEIYINPELMQGFGLSNTFGVAGFPNEEAQKSNFPMTRLNMARVYLQQTFGLGGEQETIGDGPNQLPGKKDISRITLVAGRLAVTDFFDGNTYAHDGRTSFFNWQLF